MVPDLVSDFGQGSDVTVDADDQLVQRSVNVAVSGLAAVALPWINGSRGLSPTVELLGYALQLPVMIWFAVLGWRCLRSTPDPHARDRVPVGG